MSSEVTIVGLGCELDRLFSGQRPALPMPGPPGRDDIRDLYDALAGRLRRGDAVIVIVGDWLPEEALRRVRMVHSLLQTDRIAIHITDLPPLAASVLAALAAALAPLAPGPGALACALGAVGAELHVLAWAGSVAGLQHPSVSLRHHARSLLPGSAFGIGLQPESFVAPISRRTPTVSLAVSQHPIELLLAPTQRADMSWMLDVVAPALAAVSVREVPPSLHGAHWWGTSRLVEAVGVPSSLEWLAEVTLSDPVAPCAWCGEPIPSPPCPFCGEAVAGSRRSRIASPGGASLAAAAQEAQHEA